MSDTQVTTSPKSRTDSGAAPDRAGSNGSGGALVTSQGRTSIADGVVAKIAGIAAREVAGVHAMGSGSARAFGAIKERLPGSNDANAASQGVRVEVGERQAAIDIDLVVEYGVAIADLAAAVRKNVISRIERMTGLEVTEVNLAVNDIHLGDEDGDESGQDERPPRVQ